MFAFTWLSYTGTGMLIAAVIAGFIMGGPAHAFGICTRTAILCTLIVFGREIESMASGTVKWFNPTKGYGFIQPQGGGWGRDVFVHISAVERAGLSSLNEGQAVEYEIESNRGKESATNLKVK